MSTSASLVEHLRRVEIFSGLSDPDLLQVAASCRARRYEANTVIFREGDDGDELLIILAGCVRISINVRRTDGSIGSGTINMLYTGQSFGEMVLLGGATRSATITTVEPCTLLALAARDFALICERSPRIGYQVMRNMAADLAYKLRSATLLLRGNIRWEQGELGRKH